jgi:aryl-alcohol dehydrogenase-like predicted oxidoreductase
MMQTDYRSHAIGKSKHPNCLGNQKRNMFLSLRDSLAKLQTEWVDILYVHWWDYTTTIEEVIDGLDILVKQGKVLYLGISDTPAWVAAAANTYAVAHAKTPFVIYQGIWNVMLRDLERDIVPMARHFGMAIAPFGVLGAGRFKSQSEIEQREKAGEKLRKSSFQLVTGEQEDKMREALGKVAAEHGTDSVAAIALAYILAKGPYVFPIVGGRTIEHLQGNISALSIRLTEEQIKFLEAVKPLDKGFPHNVIGNAMGENPFMGMTAELDFVKPSKAIGYD